MPGDDDDQDDVFTLDLDPVEDEPEDDGSTAPIKPPSARRRKDAPSDEGEGRGAARLWDAMTSRVPRPQAKRLVVESYGKTKRGTPNVKAAAAEIGVHPDTVRRWIRTGMPKKSPSAEQLRSRWETSRAGRRASISPDRRKALRTASATSTFRGALTGFVWVDTHDPRNGEERSFNFDLKGSAARELNEALIDGEDEKALEILESNLDGFGSDVHVDLTDFSWKNLP